MVVERGQFRPVVGGAFEYRVDSAAVGDTGIEFVEDAEQFSADVVWYFAREGRFQYRHLRLPLELVLQVSEDNTRWRRLERQFGQFIGAFLLEGVLQDEIEQGFFAFDIGVERAGSNAH